MRALGFRRITRTVRARPVAAGAFDRSVHPGLGEVLDRGTVEVGELDADEVARRVGGLDAERGAVRGQRGDDRGSGLLRALRGAEGLPRTVDVGLEGWCVRSDLG